jgi:hypothetical protein
MRSPRFGLPAQPKVPPLALEKTPTEAESDEERKQAKFDSVLFRPCIVPRDIIHKAAAHVEDGLEGRDVHGKAFAMRQDAFTRFCFNVQTSEHFLRVVIVCMLLLMGLTVFEADPSVSVKLVMFGCYLVISVDVGLVRVSLSICCSKV